MKFIKCTILVFTFLGLMSTSLLSQQDREQKPGVPKEKIDLNFILKGRVTNLKTGENVPDADITVMEASQQRVIKETKADAQGAYEVEVPRGVDLEVKAQAPSLFFDAFKTRMAMNDPRQEVVHNFELPSELQLRLNFPTNQYENPYPYVLDDDGNETDQRWQDAIEQVAQDLNKYQQMIAKVIITGHTDSDGSEKSNLELGEKRAEFLREELEKNDVSSKIMEVKTAGENELLPKKEGESNSDWKKRCRRVVMSKEMKK